MIPEFSKYLWDYPIKYSGNQKLIGPISDRVHPPPGSEVFVGKIPKEATEVDLFPFFSKVGNIFKIRLMVLPETWKNRGYAYVTFTSPVEAQMAIQTLNTVIFKETYLAIEKSYDNCRLFLGGIPDYKSKDDVWRELCNIGMDDIVDVIMYRSYSNRAKNRGFVFVEFPNHQIAAEAIFRWRNLELWGHRVVVDWSTPLPDVDRNVLDKVKILFLRNLNVVERKEVFEATLRSVLGTMPLEKIFKFKDYSFVHFTSREEAELGMKLLKEYYTGTNVEIVWAVPQQYAPKKVYSRGLLSSPPRHSQVSTPLRRNQSTSILQSSLDMSQCTYDITQPVPDMSRSTHDMTQLNLDMSQHNHDMSQLGLDMGSLNLSMPHSNMGAGQLVPSNLIQPSLGGALDFYRSYVHPFVANNSSPLDFEQPTNQFLATSTPTKQKPSCSSDDSGINTSINNLTCTRKIPDELDAIPTEYIPKDWIENCSTKCESYNPDSWSRFKFDYD